MTRKGWFTAAPVVRHFQSILLAFVGLTIALALGEIAARWATSSNFEERAQQRSQKKERPLRYYLPTPGTNTQDFVYPAEKATSTFRIAVVGDSFSFAPKMQFDDSFSKRLERFLNLNFSSLNPSTDDGSLPGQFTRAEVMNWGAPGLNTQQEIAVTQRALATRPDLLVLQITLNDPQLRPLNLEPPEVQRKYGRLPLDLNANWFSRNSALVRLVLSRLHNSSTVRNYIDYHRQLFATGEARSRFLSSLEKIISITNKNAPRTKLVVVLFPLFDFPLDDSYPFQEIHDDLSEQLRSRNVAFLDLLSSFKGIPFSRLQLIPGKDSHPNEIAHRIAAERILRWLIKRGLVPRSMAPLRVYTQRDNLKELSINREARTTNERPKSKSRIKKPKAK